VDRSGPEWPFIPHVFPTAALAWGMDPLFVRPPISTAGWWAWHGLLDVIAGDWAPGYSSRRGGAQGGRLVPEGTDAPAGQVGKAPSRRGCCAWQRDLAMIDDEQGSGTALPGILATRLGVVRAKGSSTATRWGTATTMEGRDATLSPRTPTTARIRRHSVRPCCGGGASGCGVVGAAAPWVHIRHSESASARTRLTEKSST
jgi:hypothetical protein